jgi:hypothetical protein
VRDLDEVLRGDGIIYHLEDLSLDIDGEQCEAPFPIAVLLTFSIRIRKKLTLRAGNWRVRVLWRLRDDGHGGRVDVADAVEVYLNVT